MTIMPSLPTTAHALCIFVPMKYRLSATLAGSAYHVFLAGTLGPAAAVAGCAALAGGAAGGGIHNRSNVPDQSTPAACLAALTRPSTVVGAVCPDAMPIPATRTPITPILMRSD